jgi:hypothetical protein
MEVRNRTAILRRLVLLRARALPFRIGEFDADLATKLPEQ